MRHQAPIRARHPNRAPSPGQASDLRTVVLGEVNRLVRPSDANTKSRPPRCVAGGKSAGHRRCWAAVGLPRRVSAAIPDRSGRWRVPLVGHEPGQRVPNECRHAGEPSGRVAEHLQPSSALTGGRVIGSDDLRRMLGADQRTPAVTRMRADHHVRDRTGQRRAVNLPLHRVQAVALPPRPRHVIRRTGRVGDPIISSRCTTESTTGAQKFVRLLRWKSRYALVAPGGPAGSG
jgi:hypothetical protein